MFRKLFTLKMLTFIIVFSLAQALPGWTNQYKIVSEGKIEYVANEVLIKLRPGSAGSQRPSAEVENQIRAILRDVKIPQQIEEARPVFNLSPVVLGKAARTHTAFYRLAEEKLANIYRLQFAENIDVRETVQKLRQHPEVEYAEPNYLARACVIPNDSLFSQQWALNNTGQYFLPDADIDAPEAWDIETGDTTIIIGILDTGVDYLHPDLAANVVSSGRDFVNGDDDAMDDNGHGTHVAGIAAAVANNQRGIAGVAWHAKILPVKVLNSKGMGTYSNIADGVIWAVEQGAKIINLSLGGYAESYILKDALETAYSQAVIIAAAGNDGIEYDDLGHSFYPASWHFVLGVGATDVRLDPQTGSYRESRASFSNYGVNANVYAPGVNILSTFPEFHPLRHSYKPLAGTSMAAPIVSGVAALLRSHFPDWSNELLRGQIINTAVGFDEGVQVNAFNALSTVISPRVELYSTTVLDTLPGGDSDGQPDAGETVELILEFENSWGPAYDVQVTLKPHSLEDTAFVTILDSVAELGNLSAYAHANNATNPFLVQIKSTTPNNQEVYLDYHLTAQGDYQTEGNFKLTIQRGTEVGGVLSENTVWSSNYLYIVTANVLVPEGIRLTIEPGTEIWFANDRYLRVDGELVAIGTENEPIIFTSNDPNAAPGSYQGIKFTDSAVDAQFDSSGNYLSGSTIQYAEIKYAGQVPPGGDGGAIFVESASPYLAHNYVHDNNWGGIVLVSSSARVEYNLISSNYGLGGLRLHSFSGLARYNTLRGNHTDRAGGIYVDYSDGRIEYNLIVGNYSADTDGGGGMFVSGSNAQIRYNVLSQNRNESRGGAVSFAYEDRSTFEYNTVVNNYGGIVLYSSQPVIRYNNILHNHRAGFPYEIEQYIPFSGLSSLDVNAIRNYWGTSDSDSLSKWIWDFYDDFDLGKVNADSAASEPIPRAPGFLHRVDITPPSPIGSETVQFNLTFSTPMDIQTQPRVTFGVAEPYTQHRISGDWVDSLHWQGEYQVTVMTGDGINYLRVADARSKNGLKIPDDHWFSFVINAMGASSVDFTAEARDGYVELEWSSPGLEELLGYNMYRFEQINDTTFSDTIQINENLITDTTYQDTRIENGKVYFYMYTAVRTDFKESDFSNAVSVTAISGLNHATELPRKFARRPNYPNPFNPITTIAYDLPRAVHVKLIIYDVLGRKVATLVDREQPAGRYRLVWNAAGASSGIYFYSLQAGDFKQIRKMVLLR